MFDQKNKIIFIHIGKTGGTSISKALGLQFVDQTPFYSGPPLNERTHIPAKVLFDLVEPQWQNYFSFTIVRNPWDRVVSQFYFRIKKGKIKRNSIDINQWIESVYVFQEEKYRFMDDVPLFYKDQFYWTCDDNQKPLLNFIGKFENLNSDFNHVCKTVGIKPPILPTINKTKHMHYRQLMNSKSAKIIEKFFIRDIKNFNYSF